jgi:hypothetical protein
MAVAHLYLRRQVWEHLRHGRDDRGAPHQGSVTTGDSRLWEHARQQGEGGRIGRHARHASAARGEQRRRRADPTRTR